MEVISQIEFNFCIAALKTVMLKILQVSNMFVKMNVTTRARLTQFLLTLCYQLTMKRSSLFVEGYCYIDVAAKVSSLFVMVLFTFLYSDTIRLVA